MHGKIKAVTNEKRRARGRPKSCDRAALSTLLIRVGRQLFIAKGYGATSMNEIAYAARVSKGTLYARFRSKAELFHAIIDTEIFKNNAVGRPVRPKPRTLEAMLGNFAERALRFNLSEEIIELNRLIFNEVERFPELRQALMIRTRAGAKHISDIIREYAGIEAIPCRDSDEAAEMFITLTRGLYIDILHGMRPATVAEIKRWNRKTLKLFMAGRQHW